MNGRFVCLGFSLVGGALLCAYAQAQVAGKPSPPVVPVQADLKAETEVLRQTDQGTLILNARNTPMGEVFEKLSKFSGKKYIVSDEVRKLKVNLRVSETNAEGMFQALVRKLSLATGKVGDDTILIVSGTTFRMPIQLPEIKLVQPAPRSQTRDGFAFGPTDKPALKREGVKPFEFNGGTSYFVPLAPQVLGNPPASVIPNVELYTQDGPVR